MLPLISFFLNGLFHRVLLAFYAKEHCLPQAKLLSPDVSADLVMLQFSPRLRT